MTDETRLQHAMSALTGLSVGDAFGEQFFRPPHLVQEMVEKRRFPEGPWPYTDDTAMAMSIVEILREHEEIHQEALARRFADRYAAEPDRGYGGGAHRILAAIGRGTDWEVAAGAAFGGQGSFGNGGAMRAAPLGAFFADDYDRAADEARKSAEITHAHEEGQAGAVAIAVAAAAAVRFREETGSVSRLFDEVLQRLPDTKVRANVEAAAGYPLDAAPTDAAARLGSGSRVSAMDTCGFSIWCAVRHLEDFEEAMWAAVSGLGDRDTTCAIVGGIVGSHLGRDGVPEEWIESREPVLLRDL